HAPAASYTRAVTRGAFVRTTPIYPPTVVSQTRTHSPPPLTRTGTPELSLESYSDDELETLHFPSQGETKASASSTIPTVMGYATLGVG
ncbi:hypothetical protein RYX56_22985, partial [Alkalihalophilus lindianensis]